MKDKPIPFLEQISRVNLTAPHVSFKIELLIENKYHNEQNKWNEIWNDLDLIYELWRALDVRTITMYPLSLTVT